MLICWTKRCSPWSLARWSSGRRHITHHMRPGFVKWDVILKHFGVSTCSSRNPDDSTEENSAFLALPGTGMTIARHSFHSMSKRRNGQARRSSHDCLWKNKHENGKSPHHVLTKYILITSWNDPCSQFGLLFFFRCNLCHWKIVDSIVICFLERNMCSLSFAICVKFPDNSLWLANDIFVIWREQTCYSRYFTRTWTRT